MAVKFSVVPQLDTGAAELLFSRLLGHPNVVQTYNAKVAILDAQVGSFCRTHSRWRARHSGPCTGSPRAGTSPRGRRFARKQRPLPTQARSSCRAAHGQQRATRWTPGTHATTCTRSALCSLIPHSRGHCPTHSTPANILATHAEHELRAVESLTAPSTAPHLITHTLAFGTCF